MIPFRNLRMRKKRVMTARESRLHALRHIVIKRQVSAKRVIRILPIAVLRLIDGLLKRKSATKSPHKLTDREKVNSQTTHPPNDRTAE